MKPLVAVALLYATTTYCSGAHIGTDNGGSFASPDMHYAVIIAPTVMPGSSAVSLGLLTHESTQCCSIRMLVDAALMFCGHRVLMK
jgi:hypothetical protein